MYCWNAVILSGKVPELFHLIRRRQKKSKKIAEFSGQGLRVLAFAYKESEGPLTIESEENLIFLGLIAMMDPPRPEAIQAVADAKRAGIRTVMITGDHKITARAIAKQLGIYQEGIWL